MWSSVYASDVHCPNAKKTEGQGKYYLIAKNVGPAFLWSNKRWVCPSIYPSVCPSVAYIANNSRTERPSVPKFGKKFPHLRCDLRTSFKVKRSKVRVTRFINADTHRASPYLPSGKAYELQTGYTDGGQRPASATGQRSKS